MAIAVQPRILVVDDTQEILDLLREFLEDEGYRVTTSQALLNLDKVKALAPDVIVQDIMFAHEQQGWKFLTLSRIDPVVARIPHVLCTGATAVVNEPSMAEQLDRMGVRVVLKPFNFDDLLTALSAMLAAERLIDQSGDSAA